MSNAIAWIAAVILGISLVAMTVSAIDKEGELQDAKTAKHVSQMDAETRRIVGGGK